MNKDSTTYQKIKDLVHAALWSNTTDGIHPTPVPTPLVLNAAENAIDLSLSPGPSEPPVAWAYWTTISNSTGSEAAAPKTIEDLYANDLPTSAPPPQPSWLGVGQGGSWEGFPGYQTAALAGCGHVKDGHGHPTGLEPGVYHVTDKSLQAIQEGGHFGNPALYGFNPSETPGGTTVTWACGCTYQIEATIWAETDSTSKVWTRTKACMELMQYALGDQK